MKMFPFSYTNIYRYGGYQRTSGEITSMIDKEDCTLEKILLHEELSTELQLENPKLLD